MLVLLTPVTCHVNTSNTIIVISTYFLLGGYEAGDVRRLFEILNIDNIFEKIEKLCKDFPEASISEAFKNTFKTQKRCLIFIVSKE